jgi:hypothetical protein
VKLNFGGPKMSFIGSYIECEAWIEYVEIQFNSSQLIKVGSRQRLLLCLLVDGISQWHCTPYVLPFGKQTLTYNVLKLHLHFAFCLKFISKKIPMEIRAVSPHTSPEHDQADYFFI